MRLGRRHFLGLLGASTASLSIADAEPRRPKYIFLMIGDGMGVAQRTMADRYARLMVEDRRDGLRMQNLPVNGLTTTHNSEGKVTDSGAAGTALACGVKTVNRALGMLPDLKTPVRSLVADAMKSGRKVGIVTDVPVDHATPASFYASVPNRGMYYEVDQYLALSGIHYVAGETMLGRNTAAGRVSPSVLLKRGGYLHVKDRKGFDQLKPGCGKVLVEKDVRYNIEGPPEISLSDFTRKGIELLDSDDGFFMMVEGGKIDWCGHANDLLANIHETLSFDRAIGEVLDFCEKHPEDSLVVITADHECGGLEVVEDAISERFTPCAQAQQFQSGHYAKNLEMWKKAGNVSAEEAFKRMVESFGLTQLSEEETLAVRNGIDAAMGVALPKGGDKALKKMYGRKNPAVVSCLHQVSKTAGARWGGFSHTSAPVKTSAYGVGADLFSGKTDNTDIAKRLRSLIVS